MKISIAAVTVLVLAIGISSVAMAAERDKQIRRGKYLVAIMDCGGCHTPGALVGQPDPKRFLAGSDIGFGVPNLGYFYPSNLTPDRDTGIGGWSEADIVKAIRTGVRPDGRILVVMPWRSYAALNKADAGAVAAYLKSLPAIRNAAPPLTAAAAKAPAPYLDVVMPK